MRHFGKTWKVWTLILPLKMGACDLLPEHGGFRYYLSQLGGPFETLARQTFENVGAAIVGQDS